MTAPSTPSVELRAAYEFTCETCGRDQFVRTITSTADPELFREVGIAAGLVPESGEIPEDFKVTVYGKKPQQVKCVHCGQIHRVE